MCLHSTGILWLQSELSLQTAKLFRNLERNACICFWSFLQGFEEVSWTVMKLKHLWRLIFNLVSSLEKPSKLTLHAFSTRARSLIFHFCIYLMHETCVTRLCCFSSLPPPSPLAPRHPRLFTSPDSAQETALRGEERSLQCAAWQHAGDLPLPDRHLHHAGGPQLALLALRLRHGLRCHMALLRGHLVPHSLL